MRTGSCALLLLVAACTFARAAPPGRAPWADAVVAADGSGQFHSVQDAIMAAPPIPAGRTWRIHVRPGTYRERLYVQRERGRIALVGEDAERTVIRFDLHANVPDSDGKPIGTFRTATVQIDADDFTVENITFENSAGPVGQALALRVDGDRVAFRNCRFVGWQDTVLLNRGRQYFEGCFISGHVDFIFGASTAFFERCTLVARRDGYVTAASTPEGQPRGFVFSRCTLRGETPEVRTYLGRPWRGFAGTVFLATEMSEVVRPEGWHNWNQPERERTVRYAEHGTTGAGARLAKRVPWARALDEAEAAALNARAVLAGSDGWDPAAAGSVTVTPPAPAAPPHEPSGGSPPRPSPDPCQSQPNASWGRGFDGQRRADLGNGCYLNPIFPGDHPDPSILKDGDEYYMTFSSFDAYPGLVVWRSRDLVNWQPVGPALRRNVGSVWAPDLVKHGGRYFIYFPARTASERTNYVVWADRITGPWSEPIDLKLPLIDPGHAVGEDGRRYLFLSAGRYVPLADDGLSVAGEVKHAYDGWRYPDDWIVESFSQEGPKILRRGEYFHMILAEGGTAGPPTGHMIVSARSKSIHGPWENSPYNPIARARSAAERWWSKGHGTLCEGPDGRWYMVYHAYENGFLTLGRQSLLEPVEWTDDGWVRLAGLDPARPITKPATTAAGAVHGLPFSGDFTQERMGVQWSFYGGGAGDAERYRIEDGTLVLEGRGQGPADASPLWFVAGDPAYEVEVEVETEGGATAGLLVFYSRRLYGGLGFDDQSLVLHRYGLDRRVPKPPGLGRRLFLRLVNDRHLVSLFYSTDGREWQRYDTRMDVSGYHHNTAYDFLSLRPALYVAGAGRARFRGFRYRALQ